MRRKFLIMCVLGLTMGLTDCISGAWQMWQAEKMAEMLGPADPQVDRKILEALKSQCECEKLDTLIETNHRLSAAVDDAMRGVFETRFRFARRKVVSGVFMLFAFGVLGYWSVKSRVGIKD